MGAADNANVSVSDLSPEALEECRTALRTAISKHSFNSKEAMTGNGCDRHLFALYVMGKGLGYADEDLKFLSAALSRPWTMSTSQLPQRQTVGEWTKPVCRENVSPSGGFGPVADGGYGVSYMVGGEDYLFFHVSSKTHAEDGTPTTTNSERFSERIVLALKDLMKIATQS
jgi:carnitine O-palmitoyltransferase 1